MRVDLFSLVLDASAVSSSRLMTATAIQMAQTGSNATRWQKTLSETPKLLQLQNITGEILAGYNSPTHTHKRIRYK